MHEGVDESLCKLCHYLQNVVQHYLFDTLVIMLKLACYLFLQLPIASVKVSVL